MDDMEDLFYWICVALVGVIFTCLAAKGWGL